MSAESAVTTAPEAFDASIPESGGGRDSESHFREMIDALPAAIYTTDAHGRLTHFNRACVEFSGRVPQLGSDHWCVTWKLFYPDGRPMSHDECPMAIALKEGRIVHGMEAIAERPDGTRVWFQPYPTVFRDASGRVTGGLNMLVDITARKHSEQARSYLATIVESSDDAIISKDLNGTITSWNAGAERLFGYTAAEAIGRPVTMLMPPERLDEEPGILQRIRRGERIDHYETVRRRKDGTLLDISLTVSPMSNADGKVIGASKIARDITERKRAQERVHAAKQEAEAANRAKDLFLATLSHELRTPLTPVVMAAASLEHAPGLSTETLDLVKMIRRNVELEVRLIDDLLDLSRITSGKLRLTLEKLDVNELVTLACGTCEPSLAAKQIRLHRQLGVLPHQVKGDAARLQQVLWNLLNNAAKFTPENGEVYVTTETIGNGNVRITVRDTGIGIAPQALPRIFDAFDQGELGVTRKFGGLGLGLAIARLLVERHNGTIRAESEGHQKGAAFIVELPALTPAKIAGGASEQAPLGDDAGQTLNLMIVEDNDDTSIMLKRILTARGYNVTTASTAAAALSLAGQHRFDIMISDLGLPDMTGCQLMKQIGEKFGIRGIAMSGYGMEEDLRNSAAAGFKDHLVKPITIAQLEQCIRRVAGNGTAENPQQTTQSR